MRVPIFSTFAPIPQASMLKCPACLQRCLSALTHHPNALPTSRRHVSSTLFRRNNLPRSRPYSTAVEQPRHDGFITAQQHKRWASKERWYPRPEDNARILAHKHRTHGPRDVGLTTTPDPLMRQLRSELRFLNDPLKLSDRIWSLLRQDDEEKATALVRMASPKLPCVVSWNHIIDWNMSKGKVNVALKIYNEMKKRAQFPDSHTYLLVLRGFAENHTLPNTLGNALAVYDSMSAKNARVPPSIIHSNAMLKVCVRVNNMDALWGVISRLPESGPGALDNVTFTTILNALGRKRYDIPTEHMSEEDFAAMRDGAVVEGRQLWDNVVKQWRRGDISIDADLTNAMGRLLLTGVRARDWDDVLSLLEQTMDITRLVPPFGSPERQDSHVAPRLRAPHVAAGLKKDVRLQNTPSGEGDESQPRGEFNSIQTSGSVDLVNRSSSPTFAQPDNNTLSLILEACLKMAAKKLADQYWDLFMQRYNIVPDLDNVNVYLRCLRQYRSSAQALELLRTEQIWANISPKAKTFRIAMSCCDRDRLNPNVMSNANQILDVMENRMSEYDPKTLSIYLELAIKTCDKEHQLYAIERAQKATVDIKSKISYLGSPNSSAKEEALEFFIKVVWAYHTMIKEDGLMPGPRAKFQARRARLQAYLDRQRPREQGVEHHERIRWNRRSGRKSTEEGPKNGHDDSSGIREVTTELEGDAYEQTARSEKD